jgi:hypothetical protein
MLDDGDDVFVDNDDTFGALLTEIGVITFDSVNAGLKLTAYPEFGDLQSSDAGI